MSHYQADVASYMTRAPMTIDVGDRVEDVAAILGARRFSSLPVVDARGSIVGVISRTDLIRAGVHPGAGRRPSAPSATRVGELMTEGPLVCEPSSTLAAAAAVCLERDVHRLFVVEHGRLVGVVSTVDFAAAVRDAGDPRQLGEVMSTPIVTIDATATVAAATAQLDARHLTGLVVVELDWPIGMFAQAEALACRDLPPTTPVGDVVDAALLCLPIDARLHRAAAHVARLDVRRVIACAAREAVGILGGLDFARVVAG